MMKAALLILLVVVVILSTIAVIEYRAYKLEKKQHDGDV